MTTALAPSTLGGLAPGPSNPPSQSSSPASPTAGFASAQQAAVSAAKSTTSHLRPGPASSSSSSSRPSTPPVNTNGINPASTSGLSGANPLDPPPGTSFADFLRSWSDVHVARWLTGLDARGSCAAHAPAFARADIRGDVLLDLDQPTLREAGVHSIGDRIRILNGVKALRQKCANSRLDTRDHKQGGNAGGGGLNGNTSNGPGGSSSVVVGPAQPSPKLTLNGTDQVEFPRTNGMSYVHQSPVYSHSTSHSEDLSLLHAYSQQTQQQQHGPAAGVAGHPQHRSRARPAPLQLRHAQQADLPRLIRDPAPPPDSARTMTSGSGGSTPLRPLPQPSMLSGSVSASMAAAMTPQQQQPPQQFPQQQNNTPGTATLSHSHHASGSRSHLPPLPPPPRSQPPLPPTNIPPSSSSSARDRERQRLHALTMPQVTPGGRRTPTQAPGDTPIHFVNQALPLVPGAQGSIPQQSAQQQQQNISMLTPISATPGTGGAQGWKGEYGLPAGPRPGNVGGSGRASPLPGTASAANIVSNPGMNISSFSSALAMNPISQLARGANSRSPAQHTKNASFSGMSRTGGNAVVSGSGLASAGVGSVHPYANVGAGSGLLAPTPAGLQHNLSPIAETFLSHHSATSGSLSTPSPPTAGTLSSLSVPPFSSGSGSSSSSNSNPNNNSSPSSSTSAPAGPTAYHVGRGPFNGPSSSNGSGTSGGNTNAGARPGTPSHGPAPSLDDLRRRLVRFHLAGDPAGPPRGTSVTISVDQCNDGVEVLERVLKKFGKLGSGARGADTDSVMDSVDSDEGGLSIDGWGVYLDFGNNDRNGELLLLLLTYELKT